MQENKKELQGKIAELQQKLWDINAKEDQERESRLVGRYFKYKNSYSCPEKESDYWWLYVKIEKIGGEVQAIKHQIDKNGMANLEVAPIFHDFTYYEEIDLAEYLRSVKEFKETVNSLI